MYSAHDRSAVGCERSAERVVGMRCDKNVASRKAHYDRGMVEISRASAKLNNVSELQLVDSDFLRKRSLALIRCEEIIEIFHSRPRGGSVVCGAEEPPEYGGKIHDSRPRIYALRSKVGAVAPDSAEIVKLRIPTERPFLCIGDGGSSVVGE